MCLSRRTIVSTEQIRAPPIATTDDALTSRLSSLLNSFVQERAKLEKEPLNFVAEIETLHDDIFKWSVTLNGPPDSPYSGGKFCLRMEFPEQYPFKPPVVSPFVSCRKVLKNNRVIIPCLTYAFPFLQLTFDTKVLDSVPLVNPNTTHLSH